MFPAILRPAHVRRRAALLALAAGLGGCASYQSLPLPEHAASAASLAQLRGYDTVATPLDMAAVRRLVLLNAPDLASQAARHRLAQAQRQQDGVLPNPVLGGSLGYLLSGPGDATAWTASLGQDLAALVTLRPRREAAQAHADALDAALLWEQWQILGKAQLLVIDVVAGERQLALQQQTVAVLDQREARVRAALAAGNLERTASSGELVAAAEARDVRDEMQRRQLDLRQQLNALLGLRPDVVLPLASTLPAPALDAAATREAFDSMYRRRPDLVALQLAYQAQQASLRAAVLAQFPPLSIGYDASQDNSRVRNGGPAVSLSLPLFDHNQHNLAIAEATREQLWQEYRARLATARDEVDALLAGYAQRQAQQQALGPATDDAAQAAAAGAQASQAGLLDLHQSTDLQVSALHRQSVRLANQQAMLEQQAALALLLGQGMPTTLTQDAIPHD